MFVIRSLLVIAAIAFAQEATTSGYGVVPIYATTPTPTEAPQQTTGASAVTQAPEIGVPAGATNTVCKVYRVVSVCPSRTINPTYTPATPLPSDYLWGCPPGKICNPRKGQPEGVGCNFEVGLPGPNYVCSPDQCEDAPKIVKQPKWAEKLGKFVLTPGLFYLDPRGFNLTYEDAYLWPGDDGKSFFPLTAVGKLPPEAPLVTEIIESEATTTITSTVTNTPTDTVATQTPEPVQPQKRGLKAVKIPKVCLIPCNRAVEIGEDQDSDAICKKDSPYEEQLDNCRSCSDKHSDNETKKSKLRVMPQLSNLTHRCDDKLDLDDNNVLGDGKRNIFFAREIDDVQVSNSTVPNAASTGLPPSSHTLATTATGKASASKTSKQSSTAPPIETNGASLSGNLASLNVLAGAILTFLAGWNMHN
ncbi:hypothetical protein AAP_04028 [Ascosphaera apis ARSEF 7405]|uniref:Uncharacterized protein n=1 Tax=Ascosphaera apis ARSEF 7405 TaxID=392613 RepID=A0A167XGZ1_9EURO|nr:hypothetical protein AAP_04028 [Ascosphaera apis ARSEF 7405]